MERYKKVLRQPPIAGGRLPVGSAFARDLERAVELEMRRWGVSRSFVIARAVAFALNVEEQADYRQFSTKQLIRRVK